MTSEIDFMVHLRNEVQLRAENISIEVAEECWKYLGVCNRHIGRLIRGELQLSDGVARECRDSMGWASKYLDDKDGLDETVAGPGRQ